ncbi:MAG: hypothetical protein Q9191_000811 [Dirinaria sp. TL-2023a]
MNPPPKDALTSDSPPAPTSFNILTLNCWGLKYIAKLRKERLHEIGHQISKAAIQPDIVGLQECWTQEDYLSIRRLTSTILPYGKFYHSGIFGGGLAILSKYPIASSSMVQYPLNGRPTAFFRGDWYVGKGVACASILLPSSAPVGSGKCKREIVDVFCTHLHAPYEREPNDSYLCHRTAQAWEIAKLLRASAERGHMVIGLGDFNMVPLSLAHQLIEAHAPVQDVWRVRYPDSSLGAASQPLEKARGRPIPNAEFNLKENGATCDGVLNTWRWSKELQKRLSKGEKISIDVDTPDPRAKRLDYIFFGNGIGSNESERWHVQSVRVGMTERHPTLDCSLSDHFSVEATISRNPDRSSALPTPAPLPASTYSHILSLISTYSARERRQRRLRLAHFITSVTISIACFIAVWWSPRAFVSFLLMLLSTLGFGAGVVDGLIGGLFMSSEIRALKEFEWEVRNARDEAERVEGMGNERVLEEIIDRPNEKKENGMP